MELSVREVRPAVADPAVAAADEQLEAATGRCRQSRALASRPEAGDEGVERRPLAHEASLVRLDRLSDPREGEVDALPVLGPHACPGRMARIVRILGDGTALRRKARALRDRRERPEDRLVGAPQRAVLGDEVDGLETRPPHFRVALDRRQGLRPERVSTAVPEKPAVVGDVPERERMPPSSTGPFAHGSAVAEAVLRRVTGRARHLSARQTLVEEQPLSEPSGVFSIGDGIRGVVRRWAERRVLEDVGARLGGKWGRGPVASGGEAYCTEV